MRLLVASILISALGGCSSPNADITQTVSEDYGGIGDITVATDDLICRPQVGSVCRKSGCQPLDAPKVWLRWKAAPKTFTRCSAEECKAWPATTSESGIFTNIAIVDSGLITRVAQDGSYMELATQGKVVYIYHGKCVKAAQR